jgi:hypothetical protein
MSRSMDASESKINASGSVRLKDRRGSRHRSRRDSTCTRSRSIPGQCILRLRNPGPASHSRSRSTGKPLRHSAAGGTSRPNLPRTRCRYRPDHDRSRKQDHCSQGPCIHRHSRGPVRRTHSRSTPPRLRRSTRPGKPSWWGWPHPCRPSRSLRRCPCRPCHQLLRSSFHRSPPSCRRRRGFRRLNCRRSRRWPDRQPHPRWLRCLGSRRRATHQGPPRRAGPNHRLPRHLPEEDGSDRPPHRPGHPRDGPPSPIRHEHSPLAAG